MTFEDLVRAAAKRGFRNLSIGRRADGKGYEASVRRPDRDAFGVHVDPDPLVAIAALLMEDDENLTRPKRRVIDTEDLI